MDAKQKVILSIVAVALCAGTSVAASAWNVSTPLYTYRMEQVSSKMGFLPTTTNGFTYMAENGYTVYNGGGCTVISDSPANTWYTCEKTCGYTCPDSCMATCLISCAGYTCTPTVCQQTCSGCG